jgi:hypothetical protein
MRDVRWASAHLSQVKRALRGPFFVKGILLDDEPARATGQAALAGLGKGSLEDGQSGGSSNTVVRSSSAVLVAWEVVIHHRFRSRKGGGMAWARGPSRPQNPGRGRSLLSGVTVEALVAAPPLAVQSHVEIGSAAAARPAASRRCPAGIPA